MCVKNWMKCSGSNLESNTHDEKYEWNLFFFYIFLYVCVCTMCMKNLIHSREKQ